MIRVSEEWNKNQALLKKYFSSSENIGKGIPLCLKMHSMLHSPGVSGIKAKTYDYLLWEDLTEKVFRMIPEKQNNSIAWNYWHITRIEDLVTSVLINNKNQTYNTGWEKRLNTKVKCTGNGMSKEDIQIFSNKIEMNELRNYRIAVGKKSQKILGALNKNELSKKVEKERLNRIFSEGGVLENSKWLLDFWSRKTIAGLLLMPVTRHQVVHLNKAFNIKETQSFAEAAKSRPIVKSTEHT